jgi:hypothetical protein
MEDTLSPEQIQNWRKIIYLQLEEKCPGAGAYAVIMPESEVIQFWKRMKIILENPPAVKTIVEKPIYNNKKQCNHSNSITGQNGQYCLDCDKYV